MTNIEKQLSDLMTRGVPEPPHPIELRIIRRRAERHRRTARAVEIATAACVVVLVASVLIIANINRSDGRRGRGAATHPPTVSTSKGLTKRPRPSAHPGLSQGDALTVTPWRARELSDLSLLDYSLVGARGQLYAYSFSGAVVSIDPRTGRIQARSARSPGLSLGTPPPLVDGYVWRIGSQTKTASGQSELMALNPVTLSPVRRLVVPAEVSGLVGTADAPVLVALLSHGVDLIDPVDGKILRRFQFTHVVSHASLSPDGSTLYVSGGPQINQSIFEFDATSGAEIAHVRVQSGVAALTATDTGVFVTGALGNTAQSFFQPRGQSALVRAFLTMGGGGGAEPAVTISGGIAWAGGTQQLACIDAADGHVRARASVRDRASISGLTELRGVVYATYESLRDGLAHALIEMTPPAACRIR